MAWPGGLTAALRTVSVCPVSGPPICLPLSASHSCAVLSEDAVTMRLPSGLNAALATAAVWPVSGSLIGLPLSASHSRAVLSQDAVTMRLPSHRRKHRLVGAKKPKNLPDPERGQGKS